MGKLTDMIFGNGVKEAYVEPSGLKAKAWALSQKLADQQKELDALRVLQPTASTAYSDHKAALERIKRNLLTGSSVCTCESCQILDTVIGNAMLTWGRGLIETVREAVEQGANTKDTLNLELRGPDADQLKHSVPGPNQSKTYAKLSFKLDDIRLPQHPKLEPTPNLEELKAAYEDDPVALELIRWIEGRLA